jgi:hypothetical protein
LTGEAGFAGAFLPRCLPTPCAGLAPAAKPPQQSVRDLASASLAS